MLEETSHPHIQTPFDAPDDGSSGAIYKQVIRRQLARVLPESFFRPSSGEFTAMSWEEKLSFFIPRVVYQIDEEDPLKISFLAVARERSTAFKFFYDLYNNYYNYFNTTHFYI